MLDLYLPHPDVPIFKTDKNFISLSLEQTRQELQQMRSEVRNINEKLDSLTRDDTRNGGKQLSKARVHYNKILHKNYDTVVGECLPADQYVEEVTLKYECGIFQRIND